MIAATSLAHPVASSLRWRRRAGKTVRLPFLLLPVLLLLACLSCLDAGASTLGVLSVVIVLGVPHGALDAEIVRPLLRPRFGRAWFGVFAVPYLGLAACVLLAWRAAPMPTLAGFLAASVWHFGVEDAGPHPLAAAARGGIPVALPVLLHPGATALFLGTISLTGMEKLPAWLVSATWLWCGVSFCWVIRALRQRQWRVLGEAAGLASLFAALPPLPAFAAYFVCLHAPGHMRSLVRTGAAPRVRTLRDAVWRALPVTGLTLLIGAALWPFFPGPPPDRLVSLTFQSLAALTLPHMLLTAAAPRPVQEDSQA